MVKQPINDIVLYTSCEYDYYYKWFIFNDINLSVWK